jgi:hypothetical protein
VMFQLWIPKQIKKLETIASKEGISVADIERRAIDEDNSDIPAVIIDPEYLVSARVKDAVADTKENKKKNSTHKPLNID